MSSSPPPIPAQASALISGRGKVTVYQETGGAVTSDFAAHNLTLIPAVQSGAIIHDNACGPGTVTQLLLTSNPSSGLKIHATDIDQVFLDAFQEDATKNNWAVDISNQKSEALSFADNYFDLSICNIGIFFTTSAGLDGAREIHRTLKPGGTAVVNCWQHVTWLAPTFAAHAATRPGVMLPRPTVNWNDGQQIQKVMLEAGFSREKMRVEQSEAWAKTDDLRTWAEKAWAFLGGLGGWHKGDEESWDKAVDVLMKGCEEAEGTKRVGEEVWMQAKQWVVIATK
jgi:SAM-dependent methyltransferase